ncbi:hypothetical protein JMG10_36030 [Nostoc ellipsosporum NOK]|jgi:predicted membrane protein|nr:hypothetical protein [Nostoc ellipsosporum NOK]
MSVFRDFREERREWRREQEERNPNGHIWTGLFLLVIGCMALIRSFGVPLPLWLFSWQMFLIALGLFIGFRKNFQGGGWLVMIIIGGIFMLNEFFLNGDLKRHIWPLILIVAGVFFVFRPRRRHRPHFFQEKKMPLNPADPDAPNSGFDKATSKDEDDFVDSTSIFGSDKKVILSKNFRGGDIVNVFGGSELDLTQADINGKVKLEVTALFGGATLIVPSHWVVRSEAVTIFGGISDKRKFTNFAENEGKTLVLTGTVIFGGIEIKSY